MVNNVYHLISTTLNDNQISPSKLANVLNKVVETLNLYNENGLSTGETQSLVIKDTIQDTQDFIIILELCDLFWKIGKMKSKYERGQLLSIGKIVKIFADPLAETGLEGEAVLLEQLSSYNLMDQLFWEKWKVKFLEEEDEDDVLGERFILCFKNGFFS